MLQQGNKGAWQHTGWPWRQSEVKFDVPENQLMSAIVGMELLFITTLLQVKIWIFVGEKLAPKQGQRLLASRSYFLCSIVMCDGQ